jgi:hypothetical protein
VATGDPIPVPYEGAPTRARFVRLTHTQWENSVQQLLALDAPTGFTEGFPSDAIVGGFSNDEKERYVTQPLYADYEAAAEALAEQVTREPASLSRIYPDTDAEGFIATFGRRAYRRDLTPDEVSAHRAAYDAGAALSGAESAFQKGARVVIQAMLQSPNFLYRIELGDQGAPLSGYELASKLSFALRDVAPGDALLDRAVAGELDTAEGIAEVARAMLDEPTAEPIFRAFHGEMLGFARYANIAKADGVSSDYTPELNDDLLEASYLFFDRIVRDGLGVRDIYTSTTAFVNSRMAPLYGVSAPGVGFAETELGPERAGYFTQAPYLILHSVNETPHSILRGVDLNLRAMCVSPGVPVAGVVLAPPIPDGTNRERVEQTTSPAVCATCHQNYINPLGFAFENFDGMGQLQSEDNGNPIDTSGTYPFTEGRQSFAGASELMAIMAASEQVHTCYAKRLSEFVLARQIDEADRETVETLSGQSRTGASVQDLVVTLVQAPEFRTRMGDEL